MNSLARAYLSIPLTAALALSACSPGPIDTAPAVELEAFDPSAATGPLLPLPKPSATADDGEVQLGKALFEDPRLSASGELACASCHDVASGGDDGRRFSTGLDGKPLPVNTPTVLNAGLNFAQFWDGRARTLEAQIRATLASEREMASSPAAAAERLAGDAELTAEFEAVYGSGPTAERVVSAVAAYVRALTTPGSAFDRFLEGERAALDAAELEGFRLFTDLGCVSCHQGRNIGGNLFQRFGVMGDYFAEREEIRPADLGRHNVTGREQDRFVFKVPTLRNVAETAPYFHDGSAETLADAVRKMLEYQLGRPAEDGDVAALVAFLETLSGNVPEALQ